MFELACIYYDLRKAYFDDRSITLDAYCDGCSEIGRLAHEAGGNINRVAQILITQKLALLRRRNERKRYRIEVRIPEPGPERDKFGNRLCSRKCKLNTRLAPNTCNYCALARSVHAFDGSTRPGPECPRYEENPHA